MIGVTPFLTQLDSRAAIKGSRDPLGVQSIWSRLGRQVVGNLTTVSNSVRDFTVLLLGYYFAERLADAGDTQGDLSVFLKWEQLAAYARFHVNDDDRFRGTERVKRYLDESSDRIRLGLDARTQILSNQKTYGLWGLYTMPGKSSGLLAGNPSRLTVSARRHVEDACLPLLTSSGRQARGIVERLRDDRPQLSLRKGSDDRAIVEDVARLLDRKLRAEERAFYKTHLVLGGPEDHDRGTGGVQAVFSELLEGTLGLAEWQPTPAGVADLAKRAAARGTLGQDLATRLRRIRTCELVLAPAVSFFERLLAHDDDTVSSAADAMNRAWGGELGNTIDLDATRAIRADFGDDEAQTRWLKLATALHHARYDEAIEVALDQNRAVMAGRGGAAPWATVEKGKLRVAFRDREAPGFPDRKQLTGYWRHAYFLRSLCDVVAAVGAKS